MAFGINIVVVSGNLTRDPELRHTPSGTAICSLRIAVNDRVKEGNEWKDRPNYFDVSVWGNREGGEGMAGWVASNLSKGTPLTVYGKLQWREWEAQDGTKRQSVEIVARDIVPGVRTGGGQQGGFSGGGGSPPASDEYAPPATGDFDPGTTGDFVPAAASAADDDIPF